MLGEEICVWTAVLAPRLTISWVCYWPAAVMTPRSDISRVIPQEYDADVMLGETFYSCTALLASRLNVSWVSYWPAAPMEPFMTTIWSGSGRRAFVPNPLSYFPQSSMSTTTQFMVSSQAPAVKPEHTKFTH